MMYDDDSTAKVCLRACLKWLLVILFYSENNKLKANLHCYGLYDVCFCQLRW